MILKKLTAILIGFVFLSACGNKENLIPDVPVNYNGSLIGGELEGITSPGNVRIVSNTAVGVAGLILYNHAGNIRAYDRCSTVNPAQKNAVVPIGGNLAEDKVSGALFNLQDGSPAKAPATMPLKRYRVSINGNLISITN
ncbi:hypothetical protein FYC62_16690 [Pedobacter aquae]|uniref:Uncharacterized protein n=1 Tax=Pedobacter aquae TaxID=2605747 RepID=A0A5C0VN84_9SPHI|nr:hypothetical protein [Pedobacter aquae]QEK53133.1 hypothetical protein FYC62_16690 [Pedobacter aquae]